MLLGEYILEQCIVDLVLTEEETRVCDLIRHHIVSIQQEIRASVQFLAVHE